ncbi:MAG: MBL fold metallo-hydrolase [Myxococcota bacterium]
MELHFLGAAQCVTGSMHVVKSDHATILLDCGLFQGRRQESFQRNRNLPAEASKVDAVVLSHAHIDHSGALPMLTKAGFSGTIYATPATRDLAAVMLADAAMIQKADARHINRSLERDGVDLGPVEPLYEAEDVVAVLSRMIALPYRATQTIAPGVRVTFYDAGHVLGSAVTALDVEDRGRVRRLVFTGDLGRRNMPILRDPEVVSGAELLITESTYGDRLHDPIGRMEDDLAAVLDRTYKRGGKVLIPSFALERAQEILYALHHLKRAGRMPPIKIYVDSPLTVRITEIFRVHPDCYDEEALKSLRSSDPPFDFEDVIYVSDAEDSKRIDADPEPSIIISASGMCEAGRILHHLRAGIEDPKNTIVIVGFQAQHTLGRRIVEHRPKVRVFGIERELRAEVVVLNGFSAHADQADLLAYAQAIKAQGPLSSIALVHGEPKAQAVLRQKLSSLSGVQIHVPDRGDRLDL